MRQSVEDSKHLFASSRELGVDEMTGLLRIPDFPAMHEALRDILDGIAAYLRCRASSECPGVPDASEEYVMLSDMLSSEHWLMTAFYCPSVLTIHLVGVCR